MRNAVGCADQLAGWRRPAARLEGVSGVACGFHKAISSALDVSGEQRVSTAS